MITKQELCDAALAKMSMGRGESLTGFSGVTLSDSLKELEAMMAEWEGRGWDLMYQFSAPDRSESDAGPLPNQDSMISLRWKSAVTSNLGVRLCLLFDIPVSSNLATEAYNGELQLGVYFVKVPKKSAAGGTGAAYGLIGSGNYAKKWQ
ncbi:TPA: packaged DNA stabilization gp4 family protein [Enterobacter ludwigii]|uniref:packaged DNA stabilization gp4 family protein n=1 Tax=Enterobacter TaxID=547 RepID=UPI0022364DED|nr:packaged DNA stabilization gp4 family protein [Enterobacter mori]MCW4985701.1 packaged DNA stabilization gp4 family protein [Enterobacter mori]